jgi:hypothetical protein
MLGKLIGILLFSLAGAFDINFAVISFRDGNYFLFGWLVMMAIWMAASIFQIGLEGRV